MQRANKVNTPRGATHQYCNIVGQCMSIDKPQQGYLSLLLLVFLAGVFEHERRPTHGFLDRSDFNSDGSSCYHGHEEGASFTFGTCWDYFSCRTNASSPQSRTDGDDSGDQGRSRLSGIGRGISRRYVDVRPCTNISTRIDSLLFQLNYSN